VSFHLLFNNLKIKIYKTTILPFVLYGVKRSVTLREEHKLRLFENRVLRPTSEEVAGGWRRLHNEELHDLYDAENIIRVNKSRRIRWTGHIARIREIKSSYNALVVKPEGRRPLQRPRHRWDDILEWMLGK
jgi:hypothetical protein